MQVNVRKRVIASIAVAAAVLGWTATAAEGSGAPAAPVVAATSAATVRVAVPAAHREARHVSSPIHRRAVHASVASAPVPQPRPAGVATIHIVTVTGASTAQAAANACAGPIEILWPGLPAEIAQHDYCGGAWFDSVVKGERIQVTGGTMPGLYVANGRRVIVGHGTSASVLNGLGTLVLQTCVGSQMVLVGLDRV